MPVFCQNLATGAVSKTLWIGCMHRQFPMGNCRFALAGWGQGELPACIRGVAAHCDVVVALLVYGESVPAVTNDAGQLSGAVSYDRVHVSTLRYASSPFQAGHIQAMLQALLLHIIAG